VSLEHCCLNNELYLLSIFDALMDFFADANGKELLRDPRDVAMSFMNTTVGDKHYYAIVKKWVKLQGQAIAILEDTPDNVFNIKYEELLQNKEDMIR